MNIEINSQKIIKRLIKFSWVLALALIIGAVGGYVYTDKYSPDSYTSKASIIIQIGVSDGLTAAQIAASQELIETCIPVFSSDTVIKGDVIDTTGLNYSVSAIRAMSSFVAVEDTQVLNISVTAPTPEDARSIANAFVVYGSQTVMEKLDGGAVTVLDPATLPDTPNPKNSTRVGVLCGGFLMLLAAAVIALITISDTRIKGIDDLNDMREDVPVIGMIPTLAPTGDRKGRSASERGEYRNV